MWHQPTVPLTRILFEYPALVFELRCLRLRKFSNATFVVIPLMNELSHHILNVLLRHASLECIPYPLIHAVHVLISRHIRRRPIAINIHQHLPRFCWRRTRVRLLVRVTRPEFTRNQLFGVCNRHAFVAVEPLLVRGQQRVDEPVDVVGVGWGGAVLFDYVGIAPGVDDPGVVWETRDAEVGGCWTPDGHLVQPEVGAVAKVDCWCCHTAEWSLGEGHVGGGR